MAAGSSGGKISKRLFLIAAGLVLAGGGIAAAVVILMAAQEGVITASELYENRMKQFALFYQTYQDVHGRPPQSLEEVSQPVGDLKFPHEILDAASDHLLAVRWGVKLDPAASRPGPDVVAAVVDPAVKNKVIVFGSDARVRVLTRQEYEAISGPKPELPGRK